MAGDWLKLEKATPDKPEMAILAKLLNVSHGEAFLSFLRVFIWADSNVTDGFVPFLSLEDVDTLSRALPGTCAALSNPSIGWLSIMPDAVAFTNWDRHNGNSAKARASMTEKKRRQRKRHLNCPPDKGTNEGTETVTREEKRRIEELHTPHAHASDSDCETKDLGPRETFLQGESPGFKRFKKAYPRKSAPAEAWRVWQATVITLVSERGQTDAEIEAWLVDRAEVYASSPAGLPPPPGDDDFRPSPAKWLRDGKFDEPYTEWQRPNAKGLHGNSHRGNSGGTRKRTPAAEAVRPTANSEDFDAIFERAVSTGIANGLEAPPPSSVQQSG